MNFLSDDQIDRLERNNEILAYEEEMKRQDAEQLERIRKSIKEISQIVRPSPTKMIAEGVKIMTNKEPVEIVAEFGILKMLKRNLVRRASKKMIRNLF